MGKVERLPERYDAGGASGQDRERTLEVRGVRVQRRRRLRRREPRLQTANHLEGLDVRREVRRVEHAGNPDVRDGQRKRERPGHHADDGVAGAAEVERCGKRIEPAAEPVAPEALADERHRRGALRILARPERAAGDRWHTEHVEHVRRDARRRHTRRLPPANQLDRGVVEHRQSGEHVVSPGPRAVFLQRAAQLGKPARALGAPDVHERRRITKRQRAEEERVGDAEGRDRQSDAERQGQRRRQRERGRMAQCPDGVAAVLP